MEQNQTKICQKQTKLHNKFYFNKKLIPKDKKVVQLSHAIIYFIVSAMFLSIPTFLDNGSSGGIFNWTPAQIEEIRIRSEIEKLEKKRKSDEMKKIMEEEKSKL